MYIYSILLLLLVVVVVLEHAVAWLVEVLCYNLKVAGSIADEVIGFFSPSSRTVALGSTQLLTEMITRILLGSKARPACNSDSLTAIREPIVYK
jgi:hypothetical protein